MVFIVFANYGKGWGDFAKKVEVGFFDSARIVAENFAGDVRSASNATHFGKITNDDFFGWSKLGNLAFFSCDAEAD